MRYRHYVTGNKVICVSSYAGKTVKGYAKCDPKDVFDLENGKKLARLRCDEKIAAKRVNRAAAKYAEAVEILKQAQAHVDRMNSYFMESQDELLKIGAELTEFVSTL